MVLRQMQHLLGRLYDAPVDYDVYDFLVTNPKHLVESNAPCRTDEQVLIRDDAGDPRLSVYIDEAVLARLATHDPLSSLNDVNLADFCTALEGVSHFQYLAWSVEWGRKVSLLELELQAEVDKYAAAIALKLAQEEGKFPERLHASLFSAVGFLPHLDADGLRRYQEANRYAARYCRSLDDRYLRCRRRRLEAWLAELRSLYRHGHHAKMHRAAGH